MTGTPMRLRAGAAHSMAAWRFRYTEDMTTRKRTRRIRADTRRKRDESLFSAMVDTAMDAIITVDERQHIVVFNPAAEQVFQCRAADAVGRPARPLHPGALPHRAPRPRRALRRDRRHGAADGQRDGALRLARGWGGIPDRGVDIAGNGGWQEALYRDPARRLDAREGGGGTRALTPAVARSVPADARSARGRARANRARAA